MILYPTETIYGIGVSVLDDSALALLFELKGRNESQTASWLVRSIDDIRQFAVVSDNAEKIAERFLPGPLTLVLPAKDVVPVSRQASDGTIGFRISADRAAQEVIADFWQKHNAPLTCTSANVSGMNPEMSPERIIQQFKEHRSNFTHFEKVIDDGPRAGVASTVVRVIGDEVSVLRAGAIATSEILSI